MPELYADDVDVLERDSRDYLKRTIKSNRNAYALLDYLHSQAEEPTNAVHQAHYPCVNTSVQCYRQFLLREKIELNRRYRCLFSVELEDLSTTEQSTTISTSDQAYTWMRPSRLRSRC